MRLLFIISISSANAGAREVETIQWKAGATTKEEKGNKRDNKTL